MSLLTCYGNNSVSDIMFIWSSGIISLRAHIVNQGAVWHPDIWNSKIIIIIVWSWFSNAIDTDAVVGLLIPPSKPEVVKLSDTSVLVQWTILPPTGSHTITGFKLQFKELVDEGTALWRTVGEEISPSQRLHELARLKPGEQTVLHNFRNLIHNCRQLVRTSCTWFYRTHESWVCVCSSPVFLIVLWQ